MGLEKTIQVIDLLLQRRRGGGNHAALPNLLVAPASLLGNWRHELQRFAPSLKFISLHRSECAAELLASVSKDPRTHLAGYDLVITTYGLVRQQSWLEEVNWALVVLDEAQAIKNPRSIQTKSVM